MTGFGQSRGIQVLLSGYGIKAKTAVLSPAPGEQVVLYSAKVHNRSGDLLDLGLMRKLSTQSWKTIKVAASDSDVTSLIQAGTAVDFFESTNHGFIASSNRKFSLFGVNVSTAETGSPVYTAQYWNGSTWSTLTTMDVPSAYSSGSQLHVFAPPIDWATEDDTGLVPEDHYAIRVLSSTAPSTAVGIDDAWLAEALTLKEAVADNGFLEVQFEPERPFIFESEESVLPYFGSAANANNIIEVSYTIRS